MKIFFAQKGVLKKVFYLFVATLSFLNCGVLTAQDTEPKFTVKFKLTVNTGDLKNALVTITKNGAPYRVIDPNGGKYSIDLDLSSEFLFTCTKMGYITKSVVFDTHIPVGRETEAFAKFTATIVLYTQPDDAVITYSQPVGRIKYSGQLQDFDYDKDYNAVAEEMQKKADSAPIPEPKPPTPNPKPTTEVKTAPPLPPSNPIPIEVKQPEIKPEPPKPKPKLIDPVIVSKPIVKNKTERILQEPRKKTTIIIVNIDGVDFEYRKEEFTWGGLYYYKNSKNITERTFEKETE